MKRIIFAVMFFLLMVNVFADENFDEAKQLIRDKVSCDKLNDGQLEEIGEYYMEQMHPGEAHKLMHKMMELEEDTKIEEQFHISMARTMYCNETNGIANMMYSGGMMNMMRNNMMNFDYNGGGDMMGYNYGNYGNMMNGIGYGFGWFGLLLMILFWIAIIWLVIWIIQQFTKHKEDKESALDILQKRFAKGEISKKEYLERKKELKE